MLQSHHQSLALALFLLFLCAHQLAAQTPLRHEDLRVIQGAPQEQAQHEMLFQYLLRQAEQATAKRLARLATINSAAEIRSWQESNRQKFLALIGELPGARTPLNARVLGEVAREGYVVRKVIFESLPEFYVTANLYVPTTGQAPYPAVLSPCGHSRNGKAYQEYQRLFIGLVKRGYVVLTYDAAGQGERIQYWDYVFRHRQIVDKSNEHGRLGVQQYLLGQNLARYLIWDGLRALDYLAGLPEVDRTRIGVTGNSGGGTLTMYLAMLDPRVKTASIVTSVTSLVKKIEARLEDAESDPEQDLFGLLPAGLDYTEMVGLIAPRPVLLGAALRDFFPIAGTRATFGELQPLYRKLGVPERVKLVEFDHEHVYSQPLREATAAWFDRWLKGVENETCEPAITLELDRTLECTLTGQVATSLGGRRIPDYNRAEAARLTVRLAARRRAPAFRRELVAKIRQRLALPATPIEPRPRQLGETKVGSLIVEKVLLETEPGIVVPLRMIRRQGLEGRLPTIVYLRDRTGAQDNPALFESLALQGRLVAVADVRGFGETQSSHNVPDKRMDYFHPRDGMDATFTYAAFYLGRPLLGMRVWDALQVTKYLRSQPQADPQRITLAGRGWAGVTGVFAAAVDAQLAGVAVEGVPVSFAEIAGSEDYAQPVSLLLPGVLKDFDLTDVYAALAPRRLLVLNPEDALTKRMAQAEARQSLEPVRRAFSRLAAQPSFAVRVVAVEAEIQAALRDWLLGLNLQQRTIIKPKE